MSGVDVGLHTRRGKRALLTAPTRLALPEKRRDPLLRIRRQIARRHQLAARRPRTPLHLRDYRLENRLDLLHQLAADVEDFAVFVDVAPGHLREIVAGAEDLACRRQDHRPNLAVAA